MLKRPITYTDFNDQQITEDFYFNLSKADLIELENREDGSSLNDTLQRIIDAENKGALIRETKHIILAAYGIKSPDGKSFIKNDEVREAFTQTAAFHALYAELILDDTLLSSFVNQIMPQEMLAKINQPATVSNNNIVAANRSVVETTGVLLPPPSNSTPSNDIAEQFKNP